MTNRQLLDKVPTILVEQRRLSGKTTHRQIPGNVPIFLAEQNRLSRTKTHSKFQARYQPSKLSRGG